MKAAHLLTLLCAAFCLLPAAHGESPEIAGIKDPVMRKELKALEEAAEILEAVNDESAAKKAVMKLTSSFRRLPPPMRADMHTLEVWAKAQNRVSFHMWRLKDEPYFEKLKMQELWTLITDPFSRPTAVK